MKTHNNMKTQKNILLLFVLSGIVAMSCKKEAIDANGQQLTETRYPGNFTHIHTSGGSPVWIAYGEEYKVEVKGSSNLVPRFNTTVSGSELNVGYEHMKLGKDDIRVYITLPKIRKVSLSGNARLILDGTFPYLPTFSADISGSGEIKLAGDMEAGQTTVNLSGSGDALLEKLRSENAELNISGSGDIRVGFSEKLKATISGSGSVYYSGSPLLETSISGTGRIIKTAP